MRSVKADPWYAKYQFMPNDIVKAFEAFVDKQTLTKVEMDKLRNYIEQYGRQKVLCAVKGIMPRDLDTIQGITRPPKRH